MKENLRVDRSYSPFGKEWSLLQTSDLARLRSVEEGWFVEYKRESIKAADKVAKSISSFANTHGGWLFYGIEEESKQNPVASKFLGIPEREVENLLQRIRQGLNSHLQPVPHFQDKVFWGPCTDIDLPDKHGIVCVYTPWSPQAPHLHTNGCVYRRVGSSSEPTPENNRVLLEDLWKRTDRLNSHYATWIQTDPEFTDAEKERPYLRVLLVPDLWQTQKPWLDADIDRIRYLMNFGGEAKLPFDTVHTNSTGIIARQLRNNDPACLTLTWKLWRSLQSEVVIPLSFYESASIAQIKLDLNGYAEAERFASILKKANFSWMRIINYNQLLAVLVGIAETQQRLLAEIGWTSGYFVKSKLLNVARTIPFLDTDAAMTELETTGVPIGFNRNMTCLPGLEPDDFSEVTNHLEHQDPELRITLQAIQMLIPIALGLGLSSDTVTAISQINGAFERARAIQERSN